jgi:3-mercaptopyruvate sulfurtransferase SseA
MRAAIILALSFALTILGSPASCRRDNSRTGNETGNASNAGDPFAAIPRIKVDELVKAIKEGRAVVVDIRAAEAYEEEHIKGAVSIPLEEIRERAPGELPADKLIVTYCA